jgi:hypothetical protein
MRKLANSTKDAATIAVLLPFAFLSALAAAVIGTAGVVATKLVDRLTR